jgi:hypothetical protein
MMMHSLSMGVALAFLFGFSRKLLAGFIPY